MYVNRKFGSLVRNENDWIHSQQTCRKKASDKTKNQQLQKITKPQNQLAVCNGETMMNLYKKKKKKRPKRNMSGVWMLNIKSKGQHKRRSRKKKQIESYPKATTTPKKMSLRCIVNSHTHTHNLFLTKMDFRFVFFFFISFHLVHTIVAQLFSFCVFFIRSSTFLDFFLYIVHATFIIWMVCLDGANRKGEKSELWSKE